VPRSVRAPSVQVPCSVRAARRPPSIVRSAPSRTDDTKQTRRADPTNAHAGGPIAIQSQPDASARQPPAHGLTTRTPTTSSVPTQRVSADADCRRGPRACASRYLALHVRVDGRPDEPRVVADLSRYARVTRRDPPVLRRNGREKCNGRESGERLCREQEQRERGGDQIREQGGMVGRREWRKIGEGKGGIVAR
jgi:hypothetical protein